MAEEETAVVQEEQAYKYEPKLITAAQDPRIVHLMNVLHAYQKITPAVTQRLSLANWSGAWSLGSRNKDWPKFLAFLGVPEAKWETASTSDDYHWYSVTDTALTFRHHIPAQSLDLRYTAALDGEWRESPYNKPTSSHWSEQQKATPRFKWRNRWLQRPTCMRCEWENIGGGEEAGHGQPAESGSVGVTSITVMERHLVSPEIINFRVWCYKPGSDADDPSGHLVPPLGVTYLRTGDEMPPVMPQQY